MRKRIVRIVLHAVAPTAVGAVLYLGYRTEHLLGWKWAEAIGIAGYAREVRSGLASLPLELPEWLRFSLPDALWLYSFTWCVATLWAARRDIETIGWLAVPVLLGVGAELGQAIGVVPGTFDPVDLVSCAAAVLLAFYTSMRAPSSAQPRLSGAER